MDLADFKKSIPKHANDFLYCDPPYLIDQKLYGKRGRDFDHEETFIDSRCYRIMIVRKYGTCIQGIVSLHPNGVMEWATRKNQMKF